MRRSVTARTLPVFPTVRLGARPSGLGWTRHGTVGPAAGSIVGRAGLQRGGPEPGAVWAENRRRRRSVVRTAGPMSRRPPSQKWIGMFSDPADAVPPCPPNPWGWDFVASSDPCRSAGSGSTSDQPRIPRSRAKSGHGGFQRPCERPRIPFQLNRLGEGDFVLIHGHGRPAEAPNPLSRCKIDPGAVISSQPGLGGDFVRVPSGQR